LFLFNTPTKGIAASLHTKEPSALFSMSATEAFQKQKKLFRDAAKAFHIKRNFADAAKAFYLKEKFFR